MSAHRVDAGDLLTRLRAAAAKGEPDRALDAEIALACGMVPHDLTRALSNGEPAEWWWDDEDCWWPPEFTTSVDAALTLMPDGSFLSVVTAGRANDIYQAAIVLPGAPNDRLTYHEAPILPLAICVAVIEARMG